MDITTSYEEKWIKPREACEILGISRQRLHALIHEGRIRCLRVAPRVSRVNFNDVINYKKFRDEYLSVMDTAPRGYFDNME